MQIEPLISVNSLLLAVGSVSLTFNSFFLRSIATDIKAMRAQQVLDGNRITALEALIDHPLRRKGDIA